MKTDEWLDVPEFSEIADIDRSVASRILRAAHEDNKPWRGTILKIRKVPGRGRGGFRYQVAARSLPENLFQEYCRRKTSASQLPALADAADKAAEAKRRIELLAKFNQLPAHRQELGQARTKVVRKCEHHIIENKLGRYEGQEDFTHEYSMRRIDMPQSVYELIPEISVRTLRRWFAAEREFGIFGLCRPAAREDAPKSRKTIDKFPEIREAILGMRHEQEFASCKRIHKFLRAQFPNETAQLSVKAVQRYVAAFAKENPALHKYLTDKDGFKNSCQLALGSQSAAAKALNDEWILDDTVCDVACVDGRPYLMAVIDVHTRCARVLVTDHPNSESVGILLRRMIIEFGIPKTIRTDNGKNYVSRHIMLMFEHMGIRHKPCDPFESSQKGIVERFIGTAQRAVSPLLPGYVGRDVAQRKRIRAKKSYAERFGDQDAAIEVSLKIKDLQTIFDQWCRDEYEREPHRGLLKSRSPKREYYSPFERFHSYAGTIRRIENERALDILLAAPIPRFIDKDGIVIDYGSYHCLELNAYMKKYVHVRRDPTDLGAIFVFDIETNRFIGTAIDHSRVGESRDYYITAKKEQMREMRALAEPIILAGKKIRRMDPLRVILNKASAQAAKVTAMPHRAVPYTTPAIEAAIDAAADNEEIKKHRKKTDRPPVKVFEPDVPMLNPTQMRRRVLAMLGRDFNERDFEILDREYPHGVREDEISRIVKRLIAPQPESAPEQPAITIVSAKVAEK